MRPSFIFPQDVNFEGFYWELITSWKNDGAGDGKFTASYTSELKVTKGSENTLNASMGMLFEGLSVGIDASSKTFQQTETTTSETHTVELTVPAQTTVHLYLKVYQFRTNIWFMNDGQGELFRVGGHECYIPAHVEGYVEIQSSEYFSREGELEGLDRIDAYYLDPEWPGYTTTYFFEDATDECMDYLWDHGVTVPTL